MADYDALLSSHLRDAYSERVMGRSPGGRALERLREAVQADAQLRAVAQARRKELDRLKPGRDFVSDQLREYLTLALEN